VNLPGCGPVLYIKGRHPKGDAVSEIRWEAPPSVVGSAGVAFNSSEAKESRKRSRSLEKLTDGQRQALEGSTLWVVSMAAALPEALAEQAAVKRLWAAGSATWRKLAARGLWVEGCADGFGVEALSEIFAEPFCAAASDRVACLTHKRAPALQNSQWATVATASSDLIRLTEPLKKRLKGCRFFYWKSATAYENLALFLPHGGIRHACGPGRTASGLKARGVDPQIFPSFEEWVAWLK
jgi:hydroxymethylbilane synthase